MYKKIAFISTLILLILIFTSIQIHSEGGDKKKSPLQKINGEPSYTKFNINNISTWFKNDGESDINQNGNSGFVYPKGSWMAAVFQSGFLWGGKVDDHIRVGGSVYRQGTVPGRVIKNSIGKWEAVNPIDPDVRIYRVRPDYKKADLSSEVKDGDGIDQNDVRKIYEKDWKEWPASQGAPFEDVNKDGVYDPSIDIPGIKGAHQTIWFVCNDFDNEATHFMYDSPPLGIEEQVTIWGYKTKGAYSNILFRKYIIINKNLDQKPFTDMYVSMWCDADIGNASDDMTGCDSTLSLGFNYNGQNSDAVYKENVPAVGFQFLQGPLVAGSSSDTAVFNDKYIIGKKNLPMTTYYYMDKGGGNLTDPAQGLYDRGTLPFYSFMQGLIPYINIPHINPTTLLPTKFPFGGDPVKGTGWVDTYANDRRFGIASGPFNMAYGDTQEIVFAEIAAGGTRNVDRLQAVTLLKEYAITAQFAYDNLFNLPGAAEMPEITATGVDREIILSWGTDLEAVNKTENYNKTGYKFEGYNIYQLPSAYAVDNEAKRIATYDVINDAKIILDSFLDNTNNIMMENIAAYGSNSGIRRYIDIKTDAFNGNLPLNNGEKYYFAVTSYVYNSDANINPKIYESVIDIIEVIPKSTTPGVRYTSKSETVINSTHISGSSGGNVNIYVIDPSLVTGDRYRVTFQETGSSEITYTITNVTKDSVVASGFRQNLALSSPLVDGLLVTVFNPSVLSKQNTPDDIFEFTAPAIIMDVKLAREDVDKINIFPNPYYGANPQEMNKYQRYVTINHLPAKATIRIFNLAGQLISTIEKNDPNTQFQRWTLTNDSGYQIGSGLYIIHIDMPELGKTKILKAAIIQEQQILDRF
ncbi:MAG: T9SS type A sorting domain-containing protein [Melioribacteraceae bacterium]|nr:T9SS type A sorting domain-containing protein [Melioribacteraceae bacterium]